ncbi:uncharacterized protein BDZ99DRAFT_250876 [Mytilinidion resinicola]|uniref:Uncharacterized protein n=1 Tax=Mytilinidion resinicola TaxID=574789 RepID=A0A6A6YXE5_9PEZI|nr:uncharacterized protein BDZ99DRAFT_250876 [Mytilinidion resinicola]KAF2813159.1 hypothetical protein BDZ99DRAFT_250876 [Mytilinidion resinicola]
MAMHVGSIICRRARGAKADTCPESVFQVKQTPDTPPAGREGPGDPSPHHPTPVVSTPSMAQHRATTARTSFHRLSHPPSRPGRTRHEASYPSDQETDVQQPACHALVLPFYSLLRRGPHVTMLRRLALNGRGVTSSGPPEWNMAATT